MANISTWPEELPQVPNAPGFSLSNVDRRSVSGTESGFQRMRLRTSRAPRPFACVLDLTVGQTMVLERFWEEDTAGGIRPFMFPAPGRHGAQLADDQDQQLMDGNDQLLVMSAWWLVRFAPGRPPPDFSVAGPNYWQASLALEVMP